MLSGPSSGKRIGVSKRITNLGKTGKRSGTITRTDDAFVLVAGDSPDLPKLNGRLIARRGAKLKDGDVIGVFAANRHAIYGNIYVGTSADFHVALVQFECI